MSMVIQNSVKIIEDYLNVSYLISRHRHDFNTYNFKDGTEISVDGGHGEDGYIRRCGDLDSRGVKWVEWSLDSDDNINEIRNKLLWGSLDIVEMVRYRPIKDLELDHLKNIIKDFEKHPAMLSDIHREVIEYWIKEKSKKA